MIIDKKDIQELDRYLEDFRKVEAYEAPDLDEPSVAFFGERPHLLLPLGFDQSRSIPDPELTVLRCQNTTANCRMRRMSRLGQKLTMEYGALTLLSTLNGSIGNPQAGHGFGSRAWMKIVCSFAGLMLILSSKSP